MHWKERARLRELAESPPKAETPKVVIEKPVPEPTKTTNKK